MNYKTTLSKKLFTLHRGNARDWTEKIDKRKVTGAEALALRPHVLSIGIGLQLQPKKYQINQTVSKPGRDLISNSPIRNEDYAANPLSRLWDTRTFEHFLQNRKFYPTRYINHNNKINKIIHTRNNALQGTL